MSVVQTHAHALDMRAEAYMRGTLATAVILFSFSALAGSITSIDKPSILMRSGEHFMTISGSGLGTDVLYTRVSTGETWVLDANADDGKGTTVITWIPLGIMNSPGSYTIEVRGGTGTTAPEPFTVFKPGRPSLSLYVPEVLLALAKSREGAYVKYEVSADGGEGTPSIDCDPVSGSLFPFGKSIIKCMAADEFGERVSANIDVTVWDGVAPTISVPRSFEIEAQDERGSSVKFEASAWDEIDGALEVKCFPDASYYFPNGRTTVNCEAADTSLNPAFGSFDIFVKPHDPGELKLAVPSEIVVTAVDEAGANVDYKVEAYGSADPDPVVQCTPESGSGFPIGESKIYCLAEDDFGARVDATIPVVVKKPEGLRLGDVAAEATSPDGAPVGFDTEAEGWSDTLVCSHESGLMFPIGETEVTCQDGPRKGSFVVTVTDTIAPHVAAVRARTASAGGKDMAVTVEVDVTDAADAMPRCSIASLVDEQGGGFQGRITGELEARVRNATAFRVQVTCVDAAGNRSNGSVPVRLATVGGERGRAN
jgi:hypothetical protein